jgi:hypothetical protein
MDQTEPAGGEGRRGGVMSGILVFRYHRLLVALHWMLAAAAMPRSTLYRSKGSVGVTASV